MKHQISLVFILLFCALSIMAQNIMTVHKVNGKSTTFKMEEVTEVSFSYEEEPEQPSQEEDWGELSSDALVATGGVNYIKDLEYEALATFNVNRLLGLDLTFGICYSDSIENPTYSDKVVTTTSVEGIDRYRVMFGHLNPNTLYYYRAFVLVGSQYFYGKTREFTTIDTEDPYRGYDYVDLGLPSGLKWATCNIGADSPEQSGWWFRFAETKPNDEEYNIIGNIRDENDILLPEYDAAIQNWGGRWRMPTVDDFDELLRECTYEEVQIGTFGGFIFTGPNGNTLKLWLPYYSVSYWTSSVEASTNHGYYLCVYQRQFHIWNIDYATNTKLIRPVAE